MLINFIIFIIIFFIFYFIDKKIVYLIQENYINYEIPPFPIDFVYTWKGEKFSNNIRESYNNELQYSLRSIDLYAPWANKIYILTDPPKKYPSWIKEDNNKIIMVDTSETFSNSSYLPNSNSNAIESTIINIKGLSEHYIYLCDDIFIGSPTKFTNFFTYDGKAVIDKKCAIDNSILKNKNINILDIDYPLTVNRFYPHVPIPQIKSLVIDFYNKYPKYIEWIRNTKTRHGLGADICEEYNLFVPCQQIHFPICKYMYSKNMAVLTNNRYKKKFMFFMNNKIYLKNGYCLLNNILKIRPMFFCINDDEKDPIKRIKVKEDMLDLFTTYYKDKPSFEK